MNADVCVVVPTLGDRLEWLATSVASAASQGDDVVVAVVAPATRCAQLESVVTSAGGVLLAQERAGQSDAINQGWREAGGGARWLTWLGDDDLLEPGAVQAGIRTLEQHPAASMVWGAVRYIDLDDRELFVFRPPPLYGPMLMRYGHNLVQQPGSLLRRSAVEAVGPLDVELRYAMDLDLFLRLSRVGPISRTRRVIASFRWHPGSLTAGNAEVSLREAEFVRRRQWSHRPWERAAERAGLAVTRLQNSWAKR